VAKGAKAVVGGHRVRNEVASGPNYYAPTVLTGATKEMALSCEETFGPVVPVFRFASEEEVIRESNDTPYGLAGYFYSNDVKRIWRVASALETGMVGINEGAIAAQAAPFGGVKESGYGREGSHWGLDEYLHTKYLCQGGLS
ncbi:MAG TPA: aldehyde dehydrogenase family protein, partial [Burkholderiaceae bacterium]